MRKIKKPNIDSAFKALKKAGYFAKQNLGMTISDGLFEVPDTHDEKYVFYHEQDNADLHAKGYCHVAWCGNGKEIVKIFKDNGVKTEWDRKDRTRIKIFAS
mgnify:CR=1 FL=1